MNYLSPGNTITAAKWNDLFAAAETRLADTLGGLSALLTKDAYYDVFASVFSVDYQWGRAFFFFDLVSPPTNLHPIVGDFLNRAFTAATVAYPALYFRQYDHAAITSMVASLTVASTSSKYGVAVLTPPTWTVWKAAIYPSGLAGLGGVDDSGLKLGTGIDPITGLPINYVPNPNCLDMSLAVIKRTVSGTDYAVTFNDVTMAERPQPFKPIDVFISAALTWDSAWDKYSLVRIINCARTAQTVTLGSASASIPGGGQQCFRKLATGWTTCGQYWHTMQPDDGRFLQVRERSASGFDSPRSVGGAASLLAPGIIADVLLSALTNCTTNYRGRLDPEKFWEMSGLYNNAAHVPASKYELAPPTGGFFPTPDSSALLGDLIVPRGKFLVANRAVPNVIHATQTVMAAGASFTFTDGTNTVANVSNMAVYNVTTSTSIPMEGTPGNPLTANWSANYSILQFAIIPQAGYITAGDVLRITFDYIPPDDHVVVDFEGFATLEAKLNAAGVLTRALTETTPYGFELPDLTNLEIYSASDWHLIDLSTSLVTFLNEHLPAAHLGTDQAATPPSLKLPLLWFAAKKVADNTASTTASYKNWNLSAGVYSLGSTVNVSVSNQAATGSVLLKRFLPTAAVSDLLNWLTATAAVDNLITIANQRVLSTPFGHVILFDEVWPLDARFTVELLSSLVIGSVELTTTKLQFDVDNRKLLVTRAFYLENQKHTGAAAAGVFPQLQPSSFLFWNWARTEQAFFNTRYFYHDPADDPLMPAVSGTHWTSQRYVSAATSYASVFYTDELSVNEFLGVVSFYEVTPIDQEIITYVSARSKPGISRMGAWRRDADVWSPFSYWLNNTGSLTYPAAGVSGSINTTSGWYAANVSSVMTNATISNPIPNALPCQVEHYNALASVVNAMPPMKYKVGQLGATSYTLNFAAGNIIVVNGGSGFTVGQSLSFNLKVASVDGGGAITGVAQNGSVVVNTYDAYATPLRPFALGGNATCDTSVGDGSALTFIPVYAPIGVQIPGTGTVPTDPYYSYLQATDFYSSTKFFPRTAFYSWNGPTTGGADPIATYLASLGMTVNATLPDSYGDTVINKYGSFTAGTYNTADGTATDWLQGFNADFKIKAQTYRWVTIDAARTLYSGLSLPLVLNQNFAPMSFNVVESTQASYEIQPSAPTVIASQGVVVDVNHYCYLTGVGNITVYGVATINGIGVSTPPDGYGADSYSGYTPANEWMPSYDFGTKVYHFYQTIPDQTINGTATTISAFAIRACEFVNDAAGSWLCDTAISSIAANQTLVNRWNRLATRKSWHRTEDTVVIGPSFSLDISGYPGTPATVWTWTQTRRTAYYGFEDDWGILNAVKYGTQNSPLQARLYLCESVPDQVVAALPVNFSYADPSFVLVADRAAAYLALGSQVLPIVADNTIESNPADIQVINGAGGAGHYEHVFTTNLFNARLVQIPIDDQNNSNPNPTPPAGGI